MPVTTVWAIRDVETRERLSYRYRSRDELLAKHPPAKFEHTGRVVEVYRTTQDLPRHPRR